MTNFWTLCVNMQWSSMHACSCAYTQKFSEVQSWVYIVNVWTMETIDRTLHKSEKTSYVYLLPHYSLPQKNIAACFSCHQENLCYIITTVQLNECCYMGIFSVSKWCINPSRHRANSFWVAMQLLWLPQLQSIEMPATTLMLACIW